MLILFTAMIKKYGYEHILILVKNILYNDYLNFKKKYMNNKMTYSETESFFQRFKLSQYKHNWINKYINKTVEQFEKTIADINIYVKVRSELMLMV